VAAQGWQLQVRAGHAADLDPGQRPRRVDRLFGGSYLTDAALMGTMEPALRQLVDAGLTLPATVSATRSIFCYTLGFVIEEQATHGREELCAPDVRRARIDANRCPLSAEAREYMFGDFDALFAAGIALIATGVDTL
jgi:hypothetical protein